MEQTESTATSTDRHFVAAEITAAWPEVFPPGRLILPEFRHMTLLFLGNKKIPPLPEPSWKLPPIGILGEKWIFLPEETPRVVAAVPTFIAGEKELLDYHAQLAPKEKFLPHISVSRGPFDTKAWMEFTCHIPFFIRGVALYKSLGHSNYELLWEKKSLLPFEEIEHTADIAYIIRGENYHQLCMHALLALSFTFPQFIDYFKNIPDVNSIENIIKLLNQWIAEIDIREGIGLKAVSYHATVEKKETLEWTMIVDV